MTVFYNLDFTVQTVGQIVAVLLVLSSTYRPVSQLAKGLSSCHKRCSWNSEGHNKKLSNIVRMQFAIFGGQKTVIYSVVAFYTMPKMKGGLYIINERVKSLKRYDQ